MDEQDAPEAPIDIARPESGRGWKWDAATRHVSFFFEEYQAAGYTEE